jgi:hypothetical protein
MGEGLMGKYAPNALNTVYANPFPILSSHCAVTTSPKAAMKKKFATKAFVVLTLRHSIRASERVVKVVPKAPRARAD